MVGRARGVCLYNVLCWDSGLGFLVVVYIVFFLVAGSTVKLKSVIWLLREGGIVTDRTLEPVTRVGGSRCTYSK